MIKSFCFFFVLTLNCPQNNVINVNRGPADRNHLSVKVFIGVVEVSDRHDDHLTLAAPEPERTFVFNEPVQFVPLAFLIVGRDWRVVAYLLGYKPKAFCDKLIRLPEHGVEWFLTFSLLKTALAYEVANCDSHSLKRILLLSRFGDEILVNVDDVASFL